MLIINDIIFVKNYSYEKVTLNNIIFKNGKGLETENDDTNTYGGVVFIDSLEGLTVNITSCIFENNTADNGGAIFANPTESTIIIDKCTFINNTANDGGAINFDADGAYLNMSNSIFKDNKVSEHGKSIYAYSTTLKLEKNTINRNYAEIYLEDSEVIKPIVTVLGNKTVNVPGGRKITLNLTVADENGNLIYYPKKSEYNYDEHLTSQ